MKTWLLIALGIAVALGIALVLGPSILPAFRTEPMTPPILDANGVEVPGSIAVIETIVLGGVEQTLTIRGLDMENPVLLHLHGGPGMPSSAWASWNDVFTELEKAFVLVHWDQRGTGKSYHKTLVEEDMRVERFVADTLELAEYLKERFGMDRIFLWGHSWGSGLGFETLRADASPFYAFIAESTRPSWNAALQLGYEKLLRLANEVGDDEAIEDLEELAPLDPVDREQAAVVWRHMERLGVGDIRDPELGAALYDYVFSNSSSEYPRYLVGRTMEGKTWSDQTIGHEVMTSGYDHMLEYPVSPVPVFFIQGRYDFNCPVELVQEYYELLEAPTKELIVFENSAHSPHMEEPARFAQELERIAREVLEEGDS